MMTRAVFEDRAFCTEDLVFTVQFDFSGLGLLLSPIAAVAALAFTCLFSLSNRDRETRWPVPGCAVVHSAWMGHRMMRGGK